MGQILILAGVTADGATYALDPFSRRWVETTFLWAQQVPSVHIGLETKPNFETSHNVVWLKVAELLTGLSKKHLKMCDAVVLRVPATEEEWVVEWENNPLDSQAGID